MDQIPVEIVTMIMECLTISGVISFSSTCRSYRRLLSTVTSTKGYAVLGKRSLMPMLNGRNVYLRNISLNNLCDSGVLRLYISKKACKSAFYSIMSKYTDGRIIFVSSKDGLPFNPVTIIDIKNGRVLALCSNDMEALPTVGVFGDASTYYICSGVFMKARLVPTFKFINGAQRRYNDHTFMSRLVRLKSPLNTLTTTGVYNGWTMPINIVYITLYLCAMMSGIPRCRTTSIDMKLPQMIAMAMYTAKPNKKARITSNTMFKRVIPAIIQEVDHSIDGELEALEPSTVKRVADDSKLLGAALKDMGILQRCEYKGSGFHRSEPVGVSAMIDVLVSLGINKSGTNSEIVRKVWKCTSPVIVDENLIPSSWTIKSIVGPKFSLANKTMYEFIDRFGIVNTL